ncbi:MAG: UvrB/UvrC motif-containing protein [Syntrophomonadaceae bacterium]|jgi:protein arginine kinase activator
MYCEECKQRPATVHLTQMYNNKKVEIHLCEVCAAQKGAFMFDVASNFSIPNLLGSLFGSNYNVKDVKPHFQVSTCPNCGMSLGDIRNTGKLGCSECYKAFAAELDPTLRRIHGNSQHIGKVPVRGGGKVLIKKKIESLKQQLQRAVAAEDYERAAEIRDMIKSAEKKA